MAFVNNGWYGFSMGVALAWDALEDLAKIDFDALGFADGTRESMLNQQKVLVASLYLDGLDLFGGVPLYTTTHSCKAQRSLLDPTNQRQCVNGRLKRCHTAS